MWGGHLDPDDAGRERSSVRQRRLKQSDAHTFKGSQLVRDRRTTVWNDVGEPTDSWRFTGRNAVVSSRWSHRTGSEPNQPVSANLYPAPQAVRISCGL